MSEPSRVVFALSVGKVPPGYVEISMWVKRDLLDEYRELMDATAVDALMATIPEGHL